MSIKKCKCGNDSFFVNEWILHKASIDPETGKLQAYSVADSGTDDTITCKKCGKDYDRTDFVGGEVEFCG